MGEGFLSVARGVGMATLGVTGFMSAAKKLIDAKFDANLGAVAAAAGVSAPALSSYRQVVERLGGSASDADDAFATLSKRMEDLKNGQGDTADILGKLAALSHTKLDFNKFMNEGRDAQMRDTLDMLNKLEPADRAYWGQKFGYSREFLKMAALQHDALTKELADTYQLTQADIDAAKQVTALAAKSEQAVNQFWTKSRTAGVKFFKWWDSKWSQMAHGIEAVEPDVEAAFRKAFTGAFDWLKSEWTWLDDKLKSLGGAVHDTLKEHGVDLGTPTASDPASSATATGDGGSLFGDWWRSRQKANAVPYSNAGNPSVPNHTVADEFIGAPTATSAAGNTPGTSTPTATVGGDALRAAGIGIGQAADAAAHAASAIAGALNPISSASAAERAAGVGVNPRDPRGIRNNNPGNINYVGQPGSVKEGGANGRFAVFGSMEEGISALAGQLQRYAARGIDTVSSIISKWAPPSENDTGGYINAVAKKLGVDANQHLDLSKNEALKALIEGITNVEVGRGRVSDSAINAGLQLHAGVGAGSRHTQNTSTNSANHNNQTVFNGGVHITTAATNSQDIAKDFNAKVRDQYMAAFYANHGLS
jgi:hypothetical protein